MSKCIALILIATAVLFLVGLGIARLFGRKNANGSGMQVGGLLLAPPLIAAGVVYSGTHFSSIQHWLGSDLAILCLISLFSLPSAVALCRSICNRVPQSNREAAMLDGASPSQFYRHVVWPVIWPPFIAALLGIAGTLTAALVIIASTTGASGKANDAPGAILGNMFADGSAFAGASILLVILSVSAHALDRSRLASTG